MSTLSHFPSVLWAEIFYLVGPLSALDRGDPKCIDLATCFGLSRTVIKHQLNDKTWKSTELHSQNLQKRKSESEFSWLLICSDPSCWNWHPSLLFTLFSLKAISGHKPHYWCLMKFRLFSTVCFQMYPQMAWLRRGKVALVAFVWLFSTVCFQMSPQIACPRGCILALVAFVWLFSTVCFQMCPQIARLRGCIVALVACVLMWILKLPT